MYWLLLAGAVLARIYMEPLVRVRADTDTLTKARIFYHWGTDYYTTEVEAHWEELGPTRVPEEPGLAYFRFVNSLYTMSTCQIGAWSDSGEIESMKLPLVLFLLGLLKTEENDDRLNSKNPTRLSRPGHEISQILAPLGNWCFFQWLMITSTTISIDRVKTTWENKETGPLLLCDLVNSRLRKSLCPRNLKTYQKHTFTWKPIQY